MPGSEVGAEPLLLAGSPEDVAAIAPALSMRGFDHVCVGGLGVIAALRQGLGALDRLRSAVVADRLRHRLAEAWSEAETTLPPGGASAIDELGDAVDAALGSGWEARLHVAPPVLGPVGNCLGVGDAEFEEVVEQLERRCRIPLLREALICDTPLDLVRLLHAQTTSAV